GGEPAELPLQSDLSQARGRGDLIVGDVVDLEGAGVGVAQHEVGCAGSVYRGDAGELPIQTRRAQEGRAGDWIVVDVVHFEPAGVDVAQREVGLAGSGADVDDA